MSLDNRLHGTASAIGALYTGVGDLALLGREIWPPEVEAFSEVFGYPPTGIEVMTGSFNVRNRGYAIMVFVHKDKPIKGLTLAQLDAIFSVDQLRGHPPVDNWADLGVGGDWGRPVRSPLRTTHSKGIRGVSRRPGIPRRPQVEPFAARIPG